MNPQSGDVSLVSGTRYQQFADVQVLDAFQSWGVVRDRKKNTSIEKKNLKSFVLVVKS